MMRATVAWAEFFDFRDPWLCRLSVEENAGTTFDDGLQNTSGPESDDRCSGSLSFDRRDAKVLDIWKYKRVTSRELVSHDGNRLTVRPIAPRQFEVRIC